MIVDVDIKTLGGLVAELDNLIKDYDDIQLNIFNQLKISCTDWQDGNSTMLEEKMKDEKKASNQFFNALKNNKKVFEYAYTEYKTIGKKIHINMEKKVTIINAVDDAINKTNAVLNNFYNVNRGFWYYEQVYINNQQSNLERLKDNLKTIKDQINYLYKKITTIEQNVSEKIAKLEEIKVGKFSFEFNGGVQ